MHIFLKKIEFYDFFVFFSGEMAPKPLSLRKGVEQRLRGAEAFPKGMERQRNCGRPDLPARAGYARIEIKKFRNGLLILSLPFFLPKR